MKTLLINIALPALIILNPLPASTMEDEKWLPPKERAKASIIAEESSGPSEKDVKYQKYLAQLEKRRESMGELERLAVRPDAHNPPTWEDVAPYRFNEVAKLRAMLIDPDFMHHWSFIAYTIGKIADRKAAIELIEFIKKPNFPEGFEYESLADSARLAAVGALSSVEYEQDVPEVLDFLEDLTDVEYVKSLGFPSDQHDLVRTKAAVSLSTIASDQSIAVLEKQKTKAERQKQGMRIKTQSVDGGPSAQEKLLDNDLRMLDLYIAEAKKARAGVVPPAPGPGDPIP